MFAPDRADARCFKGANSSRAGFQWVTGGGVILTRRFRKIGRDHLDWLIESVDVARDALRQPRRHPPQSHFASPARQPSRESRHAVGETFFRPPRQTWRQAPSSPSRRRHPSPLSPRAVIGIKTNQRFSLEAPYSLLFPLDAHESLYSPSSSSLAPHASCRPVSIYYLNWRLCGKYSGSALSLVAAQRPRFFTNPSCTNSSRIELS